MIYLATGCMMLWAIILMMVSERPAVITRAGRIQRQAGNVTQTIIAIEAERR